MVPEELFNEEVGVTMHIENIRLLWLNNQKKKEKLYNHTQKMEKTIKLKKKKNIQFEIFVTNNEMYQW